MYLFSLIFLLFPFLITAVISAPLKKVIRASIQNAFCGPHKVMRSPKLCDVTDVTKVAACRIVFTGRLGRVGRSADCSYAMPHNFMWFTQLLLN